jgi:hypothetical protein
MNAVAARFALCGRERSHIGKHHTRSLGGLRDGSLNLLCEEAGNQHDSAAKPKERSKKLLPTHWYSPNCQDRLRSLKQSSSECADVA